MLRKVFLFIVIFSLCFTNCAKCDISAKSYVLMEQSTNSVILCKNMDVRMKPASTTKILTAICAIENANLNDKVTVSYNAANNILPYHMQWGLLPWEYQSVP